MAEPPILDPEAVASLAEAVAIVIRPHLAGEPGNQRIYECLNALGSVASFIIAGTEDEKSIAHLKLFFNKVIDDEIEGLRPEPKRRLHS